MPESELRNRVPTVEGAYTPPKSVFIPPLRTTSRSSMLSAPAHMPAITVVNFGDGLADPDLILGTGIRILSANNCGRPVWAANVMTGTSPAHDTRWSSSKTADDAMNLWDTCIGSALSVLGTPGKGGSVACFGCLAWFPGHCLASVDRCRGRGGAPGAQRGRTTSTP